MTQNYNRRSRESSCLMISDLYAKKKSKWRQQIKICGPYYLLNLKEKEVLIFYVVPRCLKNKTQQMSVFWAVK